MNRLIKSAFALSLIFQSTVLLAQSEEIDQFLGLETDVLPELEGKPSAKKKELDLSPKPKWTNTEKEIVIEKEPLKGQSYSIIPWKTQDPEKFLDIDLWLRQREQRDQMPDWQVRLRDSVHSEIVGKVIKCLGRCPLYHGLLPVQSQHLTRILEGDEISTDEQSSAWIYLMDGTLVRLGHETSVSFHEINFTNEESLIVLRLNAGHIFWHPRGQREMVFNDGPETDVDAVPLLIREANLAHFERSRFAAQKDPEHLSEVLDLDELAKKDQWQEMLKLRTKNDSFLTLKNRAMIVSPNATLITTNASLDFIHVPGGKSFFKKRSQGKEEELSLHLRGYTQVQPLTIETMSWHEIDGTGRESLALESPAGELQVTELITKRIASLELAREIWLQTYTQPVLTSFGDKKKLAMEHGYSLWGDELKSRFDFLVEYTRRIETTNLRSQVNLVAKRESRGEKVISELSPLHYQKSLNRYLKSLKTRYTNKKMQIREMNDLQYYVWILKNGKL